MAVLDSYRLYGLTLMEAQDIEKAVRRRWKAGFRPDHTYEFISERLDDIYNDPHLMRVDRKYFLSKLENSRRFTNDMINELFFPVESHIKGNRL